MNITKRPYRYRLRYRYGRSIIQSHLLAYGVFFLAKMRWESIIFVLLYNNHLIVILNYKATNHAYSIVCI